MCEYCKLHKCSKANEYEEQGKLMLSGVGDKATVIQRRRGSTRFEFWIGSSRGTAFVEIDNCPMCGRKMEVSE